MGKHTERNARIWAAYIEKYWNIVERNPVMWLANIPKDELRLAWEIVESKKQPTVLAIEPRQKAA